MKSKTLDPGLLDYCVNAVQRKKLEAVITHGGIRAAARALGLHNEGLRKTVAAIERRAVVAGYAPKHDMTHPAPPPFVTRGVSTLYDREGKVRLQWHKTRLDDDQYQAGLRAAVEALAEDVPRLSPVARPAAAWSEDLLNLYVITDYHLGMYASKAEGGADWNLEIAEKLLIDVFSHMLATAPAAKVCVIGQLGDLLHCDGILPMTPTSGHILDQDGRFTAAVKVVIRVFRRIIDMALARHDFVHVLMAEGNHDISSSIWLRELFAALYEHEPRVRVDTSWTPYYVVRWGKTMLGFHHGHLKRGDSLPLMFAAAYPEDWGATRDRYVHCGHVHHEDVKEHAGVRVIQHPTLAARDSHAARGGWISKRQASAITYHRAHGKSAEFIVTPEMLGY